LSSAETEYDDYVCFGSIVIIYCYAMYSVFVFVFGDFCIDICIFIYFYLLFNLFHFIVFLFCLFALYCLSCAVSLVCVFLFLFSDEFFVQLLVQQNVWTYQMI
jgi:hypothetical protein